MKMYTGKLCIVTCKMLHTDPGETRRLTEQLNNTLAVGITEKQNGNSE
jgi:hypothetical protein